MLAKRASCAMECGSLEGVSKLHVRSEGPSLIAYTADDGENLSLNLIPGPKDRQ